MIMDPDHLNADPTVRAHKPKKFYKKQSFLMVMLLLRACGGGVIKKTVGPAGPSFSMDMGA